MPRPSWLAALAMLAAAPTSAQGGVVLSIDSPDGATAFTGTCIISGPDGERTETYDQATPLKVAFEDARGVRCRIESAGTLEVVTTGPGGNVSRTFTSGGTVTIAIGSG